MLSYVTIGSNDLARSKAFYDAVLGALGQSCFYSGDHGVAYGHPDVDPSVWILPPFDGQAATRGNGGMTAFAATSTAQVKAFHAAALAGGGMSEGEPGVREQYAPDFYIAYVRDPDGNKLAARCKSTGD